MKITNDIVYIGVNDHNIDLFEGQYVVPNGMAYNSYVILDNKIAVMDTVDRNFTHEWLDNLNKALNGKKPDYLVIQHMEPDHSANIVNFIKAYPNTKIVSSDKAFKMMNQFFGDDFKDKQVVIKEGDTLNLGKHILHFVAAPMVHWPEVMVTYDETDKVLFSADGFGKFGALDVNEDWACEARRYYIGIVGKYGLQVQALLKKASTLDIKIICPLHGPILKDNLGYYINLYDTWSAYRPEEEGICICYTSVYGHTKKAVELLAEKLKANGCPKVVVNDLARSDMAECVEDAFRYNKLVLATTTYNSEIFPFMREFINHLVERGYKNRKVAFIENGTWAPMAISTMKNMMSKLVNITYLENNVTILSNLNKESTDKLNKLANELSEEYQLRVDTKEHKTDYSALFKIGYGLYVVTSKDENNKDNGLIVNTVSQVTNTPNRVSVTINKDNYSHHIIKQTGIMNVNFLTTDTPFKVFQNFGFQSGRNVDKFKDYEKPLRSKNNLAILPNYINGFMSLKVTQYVDLGTHGMFICDITEARVISSVPSVTYAYYQDNIKPKTTAKKGWVCKICGYVYEGEVLPPDFICPICKHGASDFEKIK